MKEDEGSGPHARRRRGCAWMMTAQSGLTDAELYHFATEGWVLRERVLSPDECKALIDAADREQRRGKAKRVPGALEDGTAADGAAFGRSEVDGEHGSLLHSPEEAEVFRRAVFHPRLSPVLAQLVGGEPAVDDSTGPLGCRVFRTLPHPRRSEPEARATLTDRRYMAWHRGIRPRWGTRPAPAQQQPGRLIVSWLNTCVFLTDVDSQDDGGTVVLSGSHRQDVEHESADGAPPAPLASLVDAGHPTPATIATTVPDWDTCLTGYRQIRCPAGSVLHFTESLVHSGHAVLSSRPRYALFFQVAAPGTDRRVGWRPPYIATPWSSTSPLRTPLTRPSAADQRPAFRGLFGPYRLHSREAREILPGLYQVRAEKNFF